MKKVQLVDASILINVIDIPMEAKDRESVMAGLDAKVASDVSLVLPMAAIIETAQHVQRINNGFHRRSCAKTLHDYVEGTVEGRVPWTFFEVAWNADFLKDFFGQTPPSPPDFVESMSSKQHEAGDLLLISEFRLLRARLNKETHDVDIWTLDAGLRGAADFIRING